ncbi:hypothetical protein EDB89DRAFT_1914274 [Lactarius sanguifluus]|nr:hypothetical protein EDB89DRAFT_1914274 [Lactarius sanguifluus]
MDAPSPWSMDASWLWPWLTDVALLPWSMGVAPLSLSRRLIQGVVVAAAAVLLLLAPPRGRGRRTSPIAVVDGRCSVVVASSKVSSSPTCRRLAGASGGVVASAAAHGPVRIWQSVGVGSSASFAALTVVANRQQVDGYMTTTSVGAPSTNDRSTTAFNDLEAGRHDNDDSYDNDDNDHGPWPPTMTTVHDHRQRRRWQRWRHSNDTLSSAY